MRHFVQHFSRQMNRAIETIPSKTMEALTRYSWPGNTRELQNLTERAVILSTGNVLRVPLENLASRITPAQDGGKHQTLEQAERAHILATVKETKWVLSGPNGAATRLGVNRSTLQRRGKTFPASKKMAISSPLKASQRYSAVRSSAFLSAKPKGAKPSQVIPSPESRLHVKWDHLACPGICENCSGTAESEDASLVKERHILLQSDVQTTEIEHTQLLIVVPGVLN